MKNIGYGLQARTQNVSGPSQAILHRFSFSTCAEEGQEGKTELRAEVESRFL